MTADERRTGPPTGHADLDTLADLHAGVLEPAEAERVHGHVAGCRQCSTALATLDAVQAQLRSLPAPPLPAAVAARLDATLVHLRTHPAPDPGRPPARDPEDELALARVRRGRRLSRALGAVAAAVAVIAAAGAVTAIVRTGTGTSTSDTASGGAGSAASAPVVPQGSAGIPRTTAGGSFDQDDTGGGQAAVPAYDEASLRAALPTIAAQGTNVPLAAMADPARRTACAGSIPGAAGSLRGVQRIVYRGQPAYVFVYADGGRLTGYVVTEACGSASGLPATVLDTVP